MKLLHVPSFKSDNSEKKSCNINNCILRSLQFLVHTKCWYLLVVSGHMRRVWSVIGTMVF